MTVLVYLLPLLAAATGHLAWTRLPAGNSPADDLLERLVSATLCGLFLTGAIALLLAELGWMRPWALTAALAALSAVLWRLPRRAPPITWPSRAAIAGAAALTLLWAGALGPASEDLLGGRDQGVYVNTAAWLAREGSLRIHSDLLASAVSGPGGDLFAPRQLVPGFFIRQPEAGLIQPQFLHLYPVLLAIGWWLGGPTGALLVSPVLGVLGGIVFFLFVRLMMGTAAAWVATTLLALNLVQIWGLRNPFSEGLTQLGILAMLWAIARGVLTDGIRWGVLGGLAAATALLTRIDSTLILLGLAPAIVLIRTASPRGERWLTHVLLPVTAGAAVWGILHGWLFSHAYMTRLLARLQDLWIVAGVTLAVCVLALAFRGPAQRVIAWTQQHGRVIWTLASIGLCAAFAYGVWVRPHLEPFAVTRTGDRIYREEVLVRVGWYFSQPGLALALGGVLLALRQWLVDRRLERIPLLFVLLVFSLLYLSQPSIHPDHPWMMRRFLPIVVPGFVIGMTFALSSLWTMQGRWRRGARAAGAALLAFVVLHQASMTLPFWTFREQGGVFRQLADLARDVPPESVLLFSYREVEVRLATPLAFMWERAVLPVNRRLIGDDAAHLARVEAQIVSWLRDGREVLYLTRGDGNGPFITEAVRWDEVRRFDLTMRTMSSGTTSAPRRPRVDVEPYWLFRAAAVHAANEPCAPATVGMDRPLFGMAQGLHPLEIDGTRPFRWTMPDARIVLPACDRTGSGRPRVLRVTAACWRSPEDDDCAVRVAINGQPSGSLSLTRDPATYRLAVPDAALVEPWGPMVVHLQGPRFVPAEEGLGLDRRQLSFQLSEIALEAVTPGSENLGTADQVRSGG